MDHKQCSDVHGDFSLGVHVDGFRCKRYDGTIPEANIAENLVVDGETYWCVKSFCFVWDTVDGDGGAHLVATPVVCHDQVRLQVSQGFRCRDS